MLSKILSPAGNRRDSTATNEKVKITPALVTAMATQVAGITANRTGTLLPPMNGNQVGKTSPHF
ncbi:hypothetical protein [Shimazuella alba]|uniref:Uncharacterized protein n=1 Tax=Shimazuella alba TaxID=2690964 RepID=A0A6I4W285_9BACL|nr:hypothetical protein [Shimazuella alba]MXQ54412.1 hypothetical protein [Shimazuella alba]